jgi:hypothetical protein
LTPDVVSSICVHGVQVERANEMSEWLSDQWHRRPLAFIVVIFVIAVLLNAQHEIFNSRRPVGVAAEAIVASAIYLGCIVGSFVAAVWGWNVVYLKTNSKALAWIASISLWLAVGVGVLQAGSKIPGVGWRIIEMMKSSEDD